MPPNPSSETTASPELSIRELLQSIAKQINDGTELEVITKIQVLKAAGAVSIEDELVDVALTKISIDGDRTIVVPVQLDTGDLRVPEAVYEIHQRHVQEAILHRKEMIQILVDFVKGRRI